MLEEQIRVQAHIADREILNSLMLFEQLIAISEKLKEITKSYKKKFGVRLAVGYPAPRDNTMRELRRIAETMSLDLPPPDPESSPTTD